MQAFIRHTGVAAVLLRDNIDTDAIIPSREIRTVGKTGLAAGLFANWRYLDVAARTPDPAFVLNQPGHAGASVLLAGRNFGCGSSREHAVWALAEWGIRAVIAPSFGAIFRENCIRNGLLPAVLEADQVRALADAIALAPAQRPLTLDLQSMQVSAPGGLCLPLTLAQDDRQQLMSGLDPIGLTLQRHAEAIDRFQAADRQRHPWLHAQHPPA